MARYYGIFVKGSAKADEMLDLTSTCEFERTSNLKSNKLYYLKEIIKLTSKFDNEYEFKKALFESGVISLEDITKELSIRAKKEDNKVGKTRYPLIYKPLSELFIPKVIREKYIKKCDVQKDYIFLKKLVNAYSWNRTNTRDTNRYNSEVIIDEINSIILNYDPNYMFSENHQKYYNESKEFYNNKIKTLLEDFVNHEIFYVIGQIPNPTERKMDNVYRLDKNSNKKSIDLYGLYKLVCFYINNSSDSSLVTGKVSEDTLQSLKEEMVTEINKRRKEYERYVKEALLLAEEDRQRFSIVDNNISKKDKPKIRKRKKDNNIEGQISLFDNNY